MGSQSAVMMKMAGEQWQYGKRRISAMTNEDFNKLTPLKLYEVETAELRAMIPLMQESMRDMNKLTPIIVTEMVQMFKDFVTGILKAADETGADIFHPFFNQILALMGMPTKNLGDYSNTPDKFLPPTKDTTTPSLVTPSIKTPDVRVPFSKSPEHFKQLKADQQELLLIYEAIGTAKRKIKGSLSQLAIIQKRKPRNQKQINVEKLSLAGYQNQLLKAEALLKRFKRKHKQFPILNSQKN